MTSVWCAAPKRWSKYTTRVKDFDLDYDVKVNLRDHILSLLRLKIVQPKVGFARQGYLSVTFWLFEKPNVFESQARCDTPLIFQLHPVTLNSQTTKLHLFTNLKNFAWLTKRRILFFKYVVKSRKEIYLASCFTQMTGPFAFASMTLTITSRFDLRQWFSTITSKSDSFQWFSLLH